MKLTYLAILLTLSSADEINSSRAPCKAGENEYCETIDYEGACCADLVVRSVDPNGTGANEAVGNQYF